MARQLIEVAFGDDRVYLDDRLEEARAPDIGRAATVPNPLGVSDRELELDFERQPKQFRQPGRDSFFVGKLRSPEEGTFGYEVSSGTTRRVVAFDAEVDVRDGTVYPQHLQSLTYLGTGGLAFFTDMMDVICLLGRTFEHQLGLTAMAMGYDSTENLRMLAAQNPTRQLSSLATPHHGTYLLVNDIDYTHIQNDGAFPLDVQGKLAPRAYLLYNTDSVPRMIGTIPEELDEVRDPHRVMDWSLGNFTAALVGEHLYLLRTSNNKVHAYEVMNRGTPEETVAKVREVDVSGVPVVSVLNVA